MINAIFSSRSGGTKNFEFNGTVFGWRAIQVSLQYSALACILMAAELCTNRTYIRENVKRWQKDWQELYQDLERFMSFVILGRS